MKEPNSSNVGAVLIGRNEGERLKRCIASAQAQLDIIVYVDSGSTDGSAEYAESAGVSVIRLDMSLPFNAGRARNEGFARIRSLRPDLQFIQFVDGDCELGKDWIETGVAFLETRESYAVVAGRVRERHPDSSIYNWLCDVEWAGATGDVRSCGGIFMIRAGVFFSVDGFNEAMAAGEEPEMCYRIRKTGWKIHSLPDDMALHDAALKQFSQWWKRTVRGGMAYAHGYYLHRGDYRPHHLPENRRILIWALLIPLTTVAATVLLGLPGLYLLLAYPLQVLRQYVKSLKTYFNHRKALLYATFNTVEKFPQFLGQILFLRRLILAEKPRIIEYK